MWVVDRKYFRAGQAPQKWTVLILTLAAGLFYFFVFDNRAQVELELTLQPTVEKSEVKIYYAGEGEEFSERRMAGISTSPHKKKYQFHFTNLANVARLRLDPHTYRGEVLLKRLKISQNGFADVVLDTPEKLSLLKPLHDIAVVEQSGNGLRIVSSGGDPYFEFSHVFERTTRHWGVFLAGAAIVICFVLAVWFCGQALLRDYLYIPVLLFGVWLLIVAMATLSRENAHPDEYVHLAAVQYYEQHWLPPAVDNIEIPHAYSCYGISRLWDHDLYYFLAGKCSKMFTAFTLHTPFAQRVGNVVLFFCIVLLSFRNLSARLVAAPLLLSPQIWYLFSYCDSDAFALFMAWLIAWQFVDEKSLLNRLLLQRNFLEHDQHRETLPFFQGKVKGGAIAITTGKIFVVGCALGLLFLTKKNYLAFIVFLYIAFTTRLWFEVIDVRSKRKAVTRLITISLVGCAVFASRVGVDYAVNGFELQEKKAQIQKEQSIPAFRLETPAAERHPFLGMKERGVSWQEVLFTDLWGEKSFQSFFGVFGYLSLYGSTLYYELVRWSGLFFLCSFFGLYFYRSTVAAGLIGVAATALGVGLVAASFYHSWVLDFQPQGRYLFPFLMMFGLLCGIQKWILQRLVVVVPLCLLFSLSVYFFIFEGLLRIPKYIGV